MSGGGRTITLSSNAQGSVSRAVPRTQEEMEASWTAGVRQSADGRHTSLNISMGARSMDDKTAKLWCVWFEKHCSSIVRKGHKTTAREINFSENRLTSAGVGDICKTFAKLDIPVAVLKLYKNQIAKADAIVDFLSWGKGCVRELHLSHNCLDTKAARDIILACATVADSKGEPCYPRAGTAPIWLRLEMNDKVNGPKLGTELQSGLQRSGRPIRRSICEVESSGTCKPGYCCRATPPAVHLTYMKLFLNCDPEVVSTKKALPAKLPTTVVDAQLAPDKLAAGVAASGWGRPNMAAELAAAKNVDCGIGSHGWPQPSTSDVKVGKADAASEPANGEKVDASSFAPGVWPQMGGEPGNLGKVDKPSDRAGNTKAVRDSGVPPDRTTDGSPSVAPRQVHQEASRKMKSNKLPGGQSESSRAAVMLGETDFPSLAALANKAESPSDSKQPVGLDTGGNSAKASEAEFPSLQAPTKNHKPGSRGCKQGVPARGPATPQLAQNTGNDPKEVGEGVSFLDVTAEDKYPLQGLAAPPSPPPGLEDLCPELSVLNGECCEKPLSEPATEAITEASLSSEVESNTTTDAGQPCCLEAMLNEAPLISEEPASVTKMMLAVESYDAEADGYLSVVKGDHVNVWLEFQAPGDSGCAFPTYTYAQVRPKSHHVQSGAGWLPPHVVWERFADENGRGWAHDASTGQFVWEDEM